MIATAKTEISQWKERASFELQRGAKFSNVTIEQNVYGDLEGKSHIEYTLFYVSKRHYEFTGIEYFTGTLFGKRGSFAVMHHGSFDNRKVEGEWSIVPNSATGLLKGLKGVGRIESISRKKSNLTFEVEMMTRQYGLTF